MFKYIAAATIAVAGFTFGMSAANAGPFPGCTFYQHYNYKGASIKIGADPRAKLGEWSNKISSWKCDRGCGGALYDLENYKGKIKGIDGVNPAVRDFNDRASSIRVKCS